MLQITCKISITLELRSYYFFKTNLHINEFSLEDFVCRNNWETYTKQNVKHLKSSHGGCWSVSTLYCLRSSLQAPLLRIPTTDPLAAKELRAEAGNARNLNLDSSLTASPRDRSRSARPRGPAGPRGTWQLSEKEGERRSGGRVAEAPVPCWGSAAHSPPGVGAAP